MTDRLRRERELPNGYQFPSKGSHPFQTIDLAEVAKEWLDYYRPRWEAYEASKILTGRQGP